MVAGRASPTLLLFLVQRMPQTARKVLAFWRNARPDFIHLLR
jgi:hypothetical protein